MARFVAIPDVTLSLSSNSIDQTTLASFVLLVMLTAAQAGLVMYSLLHGFKQASSIWAIIQVNALTHATVARLRHRVSLPVFNPAVGCSSCQVPRTHETIVFPTAHCGHDMHCTAPAQHQHSISPASAQDSIASAQLSIAQHRLAQHS